MERDGGRERERGREREIDRLTWREMELESWRVGEGDR